MTSSSFSWTSINRSRFAIVMIFSIRVRRRESSDALRFLFDDNSSCLDIFSVASMSSVALMLPTGVYVIAVAYSGILLYVWLSWHFWRCSVFDYQLSSFNAFIESLLSTSVWDSLNCLNYINSFAVSRNFDIFAASAGVFISLIKSVSRLYVILHMYMNEFFNFQWRKIW